MITIKQLLMFYEFKLGQNAIKAQRNISQAFLSSIFNVRTIQRWFQEFYSRDDSLESGRRGRSNSVLNKEKLNALFTPNLRITVRKENILYIKIV